MRYSDRISFISESGGGLNPETGNHEEPVLEVTTLPCHLSTLGIDRSAKLFGEIDTGVIVARLQRPFKGLYSYAEIDGNRYQVKQHVPHRTQSVFYLEGVKL